MCLVNVNLEVSIFFIPLLKSGLWYFAIWRLAPVDNNNSSNINTEASN